MKKKIQDKSWFDDPLNHLNKVVISVCLVVFMSV